MNHADLLDRRVRERITAEEFALCEDLRSDRLRTRLRLEQERIGYGWLIDSLGRLAQGASTSA